jgi:hypothetical protein
MYGREPESTQVMLLGMSGSQSMGALVQVCRLIHGRPGQVAEADHLCSSHLLVVCGDQSSGKSSTLETISDNIQDLPLSLTSPTSFNMGGIFGVNNTGRGSAEIPYTPSTTQVPLRPGLTSEQHKRLASFNYCESPGVCSAICR